MAGRRLSLHVSALSDSEYDFYTSCLLDLIQDGENPSPNDSFTDTTVGVREVRAWMRGRFPDVKLTDVDTILKYFSPNLAHSDTMDSGQFFAALRLLIHVDEGSTLDRGLAFVQAEPPTHPRSRSASPAKANLTRAVSAPSASPKRSQLSLPPSTPRSQLHPQPQPRPRVTSSNNPFLAPSTSGSSSLPPLPPRKPQPPPPPHRTVLAPHVTTPLMQQSLQASKVGSALKHAEKLLEKERIMEVLKSSSPAPPLGRRSTSPTKSHPGPARSTSSNEKEAPPLPRRRTINHSPPRSATSWEQVATATLPTKRPPPPPKSSKPKPPPIPPKPYMSSPEHAAVDLPPPTHPDRRRPSFSTSSSSQPVRTPTHSHSHSMDSPSSDTPSFEAVYGQDFAPSRVTRSKSLHASPTSQGLGSPSISATAPASPLNRIKGRKRPESTGFSPSRHMSLLALRDRAAADEDAQSQSTPESHIQRTLEKLTKARYKAEAGFSRRGFVPEGRDGLVREDEDSNGYDRLHSALDSEASSDNEDLKRRPPIQINERWGPL